MDYLTLKWIHILSSTFLFGTGIGSAFYKFLADRGGNVQNIAQTNKHVVLADWFFTTPTVIIQPLTGVLLARTLGFPLSSSWLATSIALYFIAGACWLPVVYLQIRMRELSNQAAERNQPLDEHYWRMTRQWFWLGVPAFIAMVITYYLMVNKPLLW
jgi:Predicted integral membrane protein